MPSVYRYRRRWLRTCRALESEPAYRDGSLLVLKQNLRTDELFYELSRNPAPQSISEFKSE